MLNSFWPGRFRGSPRTSPIGAAARALGAWRLGGEPPGGFAHEIVRRQEEGPHRAVQDPRRRHRLTRSADRPPVRADQRADRPLQDAPEGPPLAPRPAHADREAARAPRVPAQEGHGALPSADGKARNPQVTVESDWHRPSTARTCRARRTHAFLTPESARALFRDLRLE